MNVIASHHMTGDNEEHYIVKSKRALSLNCRDAECKIYLHGVVETWMLKDVVSVEPYRYSSRGNEPAFCETINKVSENEWLKIVRDNLNTMGPGFAADAVMEALSKKLCK